jgi:hypothetical protein
VEKGYDGFFLDTLDTVEALLHADAARYEGADAAMAQLVADLRYEYPKAALLANRGFRLMERIAPHVDGVLVEGVRLTYDFEAKKSRPLTPDETAWMDAQLNKARSLGLPVFALDYVEPWDAERGRGAADALRRAGCRPFVSVLKLDRLPGQGETP